MSQLLRTRASLEEAAFRLFLERGYDHTTVADIAAAAGVTERTFFHHFGSKLAVAFPDQQEILALFLECVREHVTPDPDLPELCDAVEDLFERLEPLRERILQRAELRRRFPDLDLSLRRSVAEWARPIEDTLSEIGGRGSPNLTDRTLASLSIFVMFEVIEDARLEPSRAFVDVARSTCGRILAIVRYPATR